MSYNATAITTTLEGEVISYQVVEVDGEGTIVRGCGHWTYENGTSAYEAEWLSGMFSMVECITILPGTDAYKNRLAGLLLPPAYVEATQ